MNFKCEYVDTISPNITARLVFCERVLVKRLRLDLVVEVDR